MNLTIKKFYDYSLSTTIASESGKGILKRLNCIVEVMTKRVWFEVIDNNSKIASVPELDTAIEIYNKI